MTKVRKQRRVLDVTKWHRMDGDSDIEKWVNAYLSQRLGYRRNVRSDMFLAESRVIIAMVKHHMQLALVQRGLGLVEMF